MVHMGKRLTAAREYLGLSKQAVAAILRIPNEKLGYIENQKTIPMEDLQLFLKLYGLTEQDIFKSSSNVEGLENLSQKDRKAVIDLIKFKNDYKERGCRNE